VLVFLVRHAHSNPGEPDEARPLSERGRTEARALAERLASHPTPPRVVLTSPLARAQETAAELASATGAALRVEERLSPGATADDLRGAVGAERESVAAVCHQPDCSQIALALIGKDPGFAPAGVAEIELPDAT
jgi:phosphohistidine phosphatase